MTTVKFLRNILDKKLENNETALKEKILSYLIEDYTLLDEKTKSSIVYCKKCDCFKALIRINFPKD